MPPDSRIKISVERKIALGFGAALIVLLSVTGASIWNAARFRGSYDWMRETYEVFVRLDQVLTNLLSMEASTRGYLLTGDEQALQPYQAGTADLEGSLRQLHRLVADNPPQLARAMQLESLAASAQKIMAQRIAARGAPAVDAAAPAATTAEAQRVIGESWGVVREIATAERHSLDLRLKRVYHVGQLMIFAVIGASLLALGCVFVAVRQVQRDLGRRREAEAALQESFTRIEDLYNRAPCGYHSLDRTGRFVAINDTALGWLGYAREEVVGRMNFAEILAPESADRFAESFPHFMESGVAQNLEYEWKRKDGSTLPVLLNATAIYDSAGHYLASRASVFDVTLRKQAESERDRFFLISRDLLCVATFDGFFKRVNPAWEPTLGYTTEELLGSPFAEFIHPDDRARTTEEAARLAAGAETVAFENRYRCKEGTYRWLLWNARAVPSEQLIYASARDITERKQHEARIEGLHKDVEQRARLLEAANHELEAFSYSVSHDLRAPLRHIDGYANLLAKRVAATVDEESNRYLGTISKSAKRMGALIDDLLAFSKISRTTLRMESIDHDQLVSGVIADGRYEANGRAIAWQISSLLKVRGDAALLRQAWANLIENAVKYSSKSPHPQITIGSREDLAAGEYVFFVRDNGVGFDMAYADKLFGVFQRLHGPSEFEGTGIGLANVRRIILRHGGRTWAEGRVSEGASFYFSLPIISPGSATDT